MLCCSASLRVLGLSLACGMTALCACQEVCVRYAAGPVSLHHPWGDDPLAGPFFNFSGRTVKILFRKIAPGTDRTFLKATVFQSIISIAPRHAFAPCFAVRVDEEIGQRQNLESVINWNHSLSTALSRTHFTGASMFQTQTNRSSADTSLNWQFDVNPLTPPSTRKHT